MSQIQYIQVDKLDAHPDNPRKDLGDLTEIADSIKANGILQNLTVVPLLDATAAPNDAPFDGDPPFGSDPSAERYRIVIGHRRLAAAKLAGLAEVPCVVSDMPHADQVRTMLMENMQRSDLTVYEQAYGFQMMLDLGDNLDEIATKTGFSESTIRRRVKLLELDSDKFRDSVDRGATLFDYAELEKIKDLDKRNDVLDKVGTDNFKYALRQALDAQTKAEQMDVLAARLSEFATEVEDRSEYSNVKTYYASEGIDKVETPEDADSTAYYFCKSDYSTWISLLKEKVVSAEDDAVQAKREAEETARNERNTQLKEIAERAYALRFEFVKDVTITTIKKNIAAVVTASALERMNSGYKRFDDEDFLALLGVELMDEAEDDDCPFDTDEYSTPNAGSNPVVEAIAAAPMRALLFAAYCDFEDGSGQTYYQHYYGTHSDNAELNRLYDLLETLGYKMSDDEKAMRDGTHELFGVSAVSDTALSDSDADSDAEAVADTEQAA